MTLKLRSFAFTEKGIHRLARYLTFALQISELYLLAGQSNISSSCRYKPTGLTFANTTGQFQEN